MKTTKQRRKERRDHRFRVQFHSTQRCKFFHDLPCEVSGEGGCYNAHMKSRGSGGTYTSIVPLTPTVHYHFDTLSEAQWEAKYDGRTKDSVRNRAEHYANLWETRHEQNG